MLEADEFGLHPQTSREAVFPSFGGKVSAVDVGCFASFTDTSIRDIRRHSVRRGDFLTRNHWYLHVFFEVCYLRKRTGKICCAHIQ